LTEPLVLTTEMLAVLAVVALAIVLFVTEIVRVDVAAILIMILLGLTGMVSGNELFNGFSSNAVVSIIAITIIGAGLDKTGLMNQVAAKILQIGGNTEKRIIPLISGTVGIISSFMQNIGAAALFLPVVARISARSGLSMSRLLMPMGFCAILGGTITMVGSSPLILLNDLIPISNKSLEAQGLPTMDSFGLFDVTPLGLVLVATGIIYFVVAGKYILPATKDDAESGTSQPTMAYFKKLYGIEGDLFEVHVPANSPLVGIKVSTIEKNTKELAILAIRKGDKILLEPPGDEQIDPAIVLGLMGTSTNITNFCQQYQLSLSPQLNNFGELLSPARAGISEVVVPPSSNLIGKRLGDVRMRKTYGTSVLAIYRNDNVLAGDVRDAVFRSGDTMVLHCTWEDLAAMDKDKNFVVATDYPHEEMRPHKVNYALFFFAITLALVIFSDLKLSVALMAGAMGMVVSGVLNIDEAYQAVSWKSVFLLASLIPLGDAFASTGTAAWIAQETLRIMDGTPVWGLQLAVALLGTFFTLVMSNVGATALLVPLAVSIAVGAGADPRVFALTVAIAASNSFIIPTHQVNALIMGPGGYRVTDFIRTGGIMSILFLVVMMIMLNLMY